MRNRSGVAVVAAVIAALLVPAGASAATSVTLKSATTRSLTLQVTGKAHHRMRVSVTPRGIARARRVGLGRSGTRAVRLGLTRKGRLSMRNCGLRRIGLRAGGVARRGAIGCSRRAGEEDPTLIALTPGCDPFDPSACLLPWPNDYFTKAADTDTGRQLDLQITSMPRNVWGRPIDPIEFNRYDGFSPGTPIVVRVPGLDNDQAFANTNPVRETDMARYLDADAPVVVVDADTGQRHLVWAELDHHAETTDANRTLIIRPGVNFTEGHRYVVALRHLKDAAGNTIPAPDSFAAYRNQAETVPDEARRDQMESIFGTLAGAGIARGDLHLAWDFTVASEDDRAGRMLRMRDEAFAALGDENLSDGKVDGAAPKFAITSVTDQPNGEVARVVKGTFELPCFLDRPRCVQGSRFLFAGPGARDFTAIPGNTMEATFTCNVPRSATVAGAEPARPSLYGHGLLGNQSEVGAGNVRKFGNESNILFCATHWYGMAFEDLPTIATILTDVSNFPALPDRVQQGILAQLFLSRLQIHPDGFGSHPAFKDGDRVLIDNRPAADETREGFYDGNSQGGIIGGAVMAVAPDIRNGVLGVPGMNYSTLLNRSVDFETDPEHPCPAPAGEMVADIQKAVEEQEDDPKYALEVLNVSYACPLYLSYPNVAERQLLFSLMQQHWDRGEANGYAAHMTTDNYANTPTHNVLLHVALGDHQVAQVSAEVEARTIGAKGRTNAFDPGRSNDPTLFGMEKVALGGWPFAGSAYEVWDTGPERIQDGRLRGTDRPPVGNVPPYNGDDPHDDVRATKQARAQKGAFLRRGGRVTDECFAGPCYARHFNWGVE